MLLLKVVFTLLHLLPLVIAIVLQLNRRRMEKQILASSKSKSPSSQQLPGISIITTVRSPCSPIEKSLVSLLTQNYPGPLELVICAHPGEPLIETVNTLLRQSESKVSLQWVFLDRAPAGNPRTRKIARAYECARHPWIFATCVDTSFDENFLANAMQLTRTSSKVFVTSFPVISSSKSFGAKLEAMGLNADVAQFFLISNLLNSPAAYGGAFLFSKQLMESVGAWKEITPLLTDDVSLAQQFCKSGAEGILSPQGSWVEQEQHTLKGFWSRAVRWRMISKYFLPRLFWLNTLSFTLPLAFLVGLTCLNLNLLIFTTFIFVCKTLLCGGLQLALGLNFREAMKVWVIPIYEFLGMAAWCVAARRNSVDWSGVQMSIAKDGSVIAASEP